MNVTNVRPQDDVFCSEPFRPPTRCSNDVTDARGATAETDAAPCIVSAPRGSGSRLADRNEAMNRGACIVGVNYTVSSILPPPQPSPFP